MSLADTAQAGDRLSILCELRDMLAEYLAGPLEPRDVAALTLRLTDVLEQIDAMPTSKAVSAADEIAKRRTSRRGGGAANKARPASA